MKIYDGDLEFDEANHAYTFKGNFVPGVTSILSCLGKPALVPWAAKMTGDYFLAGIKQGRTDYDALHKEAKGAHRKEAMSAADIGKQVHFYAECFFKGQELPELTTPQAVKAVQGFHSWLDSHKVEVLASERRVMSKDFYYAGTCDFVARVDGVLCVGDIKTSSGIYPEMRFQTAAYQHALEEEKRFEGKDMKFPGRLILRFDKKKGDFEAKMFNNFDLDFAGFAAALNLHKTLQTIEAEI